MSRNPIPVVDVSEISACRSKRCMIIDAIREALEEIGFFVLVGHGIDRSVVDSVYSVSQKFFDLPIEKKGQVGRTGESPGGIMYFPLQSESLDAKRQIGDLKESIDFGPNYVGDNWPSEPPELRSILYSYYETMAGLAKTLRHIFAAACGLKEDYFEDKFDRHHSALRVINYPIPSEKPVPGQLRAGAHSDYGFLTILHAGCSAGLQAKTRANQWIDVPVVDDSFVVNIGDSTARWTNDRWTSTVHRVVNPSENGSQRRLSIPFFHGPNYDAIIDCLEPFCDEDNPAKYQPISYGEYADQKYKNAHGIASRT